MKNWFAPLSLFLPLSALFAQPVQTNATDTPPPVLRVLARNIEPFCFEKGGRQTGFAVDLWVEIAKVAGFQYEIRTAESAQAVVDALAAKKADIGLGALSITSQREKVIDFTHPFYNSGLDIVTGTQASSVWSLIGVVFNARLLKTLALLVVAVIVVSHLLWLAERRNNEDDFPVTYKAGLSESLWWILSVLITLGCENKSPKGFRGRAVAILWMVGGVLMISLLTASFSSSLTVSSLTGKINGPADLVGHEIATVSGSTAEKWLRSHTSRVQTFPSAREAIAAAANSEVDAVVYDEPILRYQLMKYPDKNLKQVGKLFEEQTYGFALQWKSPIHKKINEVLLELIENKTVEELNKKWFGESASDNKR